MLPGSTLALQHFLRELSAFDPAIEFTMEEGGDMINYLDSQLIFTESYKILKISFSSHRMGTYEYWGIHKCSLASSRYHKTAIITSVIHRMLQLSLDASSIETETNTITFSQLVIQLSGQMGQTSPPGSSNDEIRFGTQEKRI